MFRFFSADTVCVFHLLLGFRLLTSVSFFNFRPCTATFFSVRLSSSRGLSVTWSQAGHVLWETYGSKKKIEQKSKEISALSQGGDKDGVTSATVRFAYEPVGHKFVTFSQE